MIPTGKCPNPKCEKPVHSLKFSNLPLTIGIGMGGAYPAMTFECPHCNAVLGAQMNLDYVVGAFVKALAKK